MKRAKPSLKARLYPDARTKKQTNSESAYRCLTPPHLLPPLVFPSNLPSYFLFGEATPPPNPPVQPPPATKLRVMFRASLTQSVSCRSVCALKRALAFAACFLAASCLRFLFRRADGWHYERAITSSLCHSLLIQTPFDLKPGTALRCARSLRTQTQAGAQTICTRLPTSD